MKDWATSLAVLSAAFVGIVVVTMGLAAVIVPQAFRAAQSAAPNASSAVAVDRTPPPADQVPDAIGGTLMVTGDTEGTFVLDREAAEIGFEFDAETETARLQDGLYQLSGEDGRIAFAVDPLAVEQIDYAGLSFYPDPEECEITPGALNAVLGVASATLRCERIADIRDNGVATFDGTIMAAGDVLGLRGDLPPSGGSLAVGTRTLELSEARALLEPFGFDAQTGLASLPLINGAYESGVILDYDPHTHELDLGSVIVDGATVEAPDGACSVTRTDIGLLNPRTSVAELVVECDAVDVPEIGTVPVQGTLVVDLIGVDAPP